MTRHGIRVRICWLGMVHIAWVTQTRVVVLCKTRREELELRFRQLHEHRRRVAHERDAHDKNQTAQDQSSRMSPNVSAHWHRRFNQSDWFTTHANTAAATAILKNSTSTSKKMKSPEIMIKAKAAGDIGLFQNASQRRPGPHALTGDSPLAVRCILKPFVPSGPLAREKG